MFWLSRPSRQSLRWLGRGIKLTDALSTFSAGLLLPYLASELLEKKFNFLTSTWGLLVSLGLLAVVIAVIVSKCLHILWIEPLTREADIITAAMRHLYHSSFAATPGHRVTFLAQLSPNSRYIRPRYRYSYGSGSNLQSRSRFRWGSALAGMAWEKPDHPFVKEIPDFGEDESASLNFMQTELRLTPKEVRRLSSVTRRCRWIFCYGIAHPWSGDFIGVISIDSQNANVSEQIDMENVIRVAAIIADVVRTPSG